MKFETEKRVEKNTADHINRSINRGINESIAYFAVHTGEIPQRLEELSQEWDIERVLETNAASLSLAGLLMSFRSRKWVLLPLTVGAFLLQHAIQGWCPPVPILRRFGVRTQDEILREKNGLLALQGSFGALPGLKNRSRENRIKTALKALQG